jgi:hypothetical protein
MVDTNYHASASLLEFYQGIPVAIDAYIMPNGSVVGLAKLGAAENKIEVFSGNFEQVISEMIGKAYDFMVPVYPSHPTSVEEIDATIKYHIETRLREINFSQYLKDVTLAIVNIEGQISEISQTNPWLSKQFGELTTMLTETRSLAEDVTKRSDEARERRRYEDFEEVVSFLQTYDPAQVATQQASIDIEHVRTFLTEFIRSYRATIDAKSLSKEAYPPFYGDYPYNVEFILLPNKNVAAFFSKAKEGMKFTDMQQGFKEFEKEVPDKSFDYFLGFPNCLDFEKSTAIHHAQAQAQLDLESHDLNMALEEIPGKLKSIEEQIIKIKKSNPWLEQSLAGLLKTLETAHKPVNKLRSRIEKQRKAGTVLRSFVNIFDSSISIFPTAGELPPLPPVAEGAPAPVFEDVATAHVHTPPGEFVPMDSAAPPVSGAEDYSVVTPPGEYDLQIPLAEPGVEAEVPSMAVGSFEGGDLAEVKSMLYTFERKLADFEKRLHYIDKYTEMIQRQQNKKFKAQKDLVVLESRKGRWVGIGIGIGALTIAIILLLSNIESVGDFFSNLF